MAKNPPRVLLDTNVLISAHVFGGIPQQVYNLVLEKQIEAVTSRILIAELIETLTKKFDFELVRIEQFEKIIKKHFKMVYPNQTVAILRDNDDNRVLEAAVKGRCSYIITGDKDLLELGGYKGINILTPTEFLKEIS